MIFRMGVILYIKMFWHFDNSFAWRVFDKLLTLELFGFKVEKNGITVTKL